MASYNHRRASCADIASSDDGLLELWQRDSLCKPANAINGVERLRTINAKEAP